MRITEGRVVGRISQVLDADALLRAVQAAADALRQDMPAANAAELMSAP